MKGLLAVVVGLSALGGAFALAAQESRRGYLRETHEHLKALDQATVNFIMRKGRLPTGFEVIPNGRRMCGTERSSSPTLLVPESYAYDPWGHAYVYRNGGVESLGADGLPGGSGIDTDHRLLIGDEPCSCGAR